MSSAQPAKLLAVPGCVGDGGGGQNGPPSVGAEEGGGSMRRGVSKSAGDLHRGRSNDRSAEGSPHGSPRLHPKGGDATAEGGEGSPARPPLQQRTTSAAAFFSSLKERLLLWNRSVEENLKESIENDKTRFQRTRSRDGKPSLRRQELMDGGRSNSQPDVSVIRPDSNTTDYAADNSSIDHSSLATPPNFSPRRPPLQNATGGVGELNPLDDSSSGGRPPTSIEKREGIDLSVSSLDPAIQRSRALRQYSFFQLHVVLRKGEDLVPKDACGTSDPYVKFKVGGKLACKSKTVYKDLNPVWDETFVMAVEDAFEPVTVKVFDYDWGLQDDFMGMATIDLTTLDLNRAEDLVLTLTEPGKTEYMGKLTLEVTLVPKTQEDRDLIGGIMSSSIHYLQRGGSKLVEQQRRLKQQLWSCVVTVVLVEGRDLLPMDPDGMSDPYVKCKLGTEKYKSKPDARTLNPRWVEQFDFHLYDDQSHILEVSVWDKDARTKDDFMGKSLLDLNEFSREQTHDVWTELLEGAGKVHLLLTISGTTSSEACSDLHSYREDLREIQLIRDRYKFRKSLANMKDVGYLVVKVFRAQGLASADIGGKSDPFCVLELVNDRVQTHTEYKTLTPTWNKIFTFHVRDIHSVMELTVYDEDRDHKVEFLGKVAVPLLKIVNGEKKWYALKDKKMRTRAKGHYPEVLMELSVYWNSVRAAIRTFTPPEEKFMQKELKFNRQIFIRNVNRLKGTIAQMVEGGVLINRIFTWENPLQSGMAFVGFLLGVYYFEMYMIPIALLGIFFKNYVVISLVGSLMHKDDELETCNDEDEDEDDDKDKITKEEEKKSLKERLVAIQEVTATVQNAVGFIASMQESVKNTFNFSVPFLSWLMVVALAGAAVVLYYVPLRALVLLVGVNKFLKQLLRPNTINNNELLDFLARVPDDENLRDYREIRLSPTMMEERRRELRKKKLN